MKPRRRQTAAKNTLGVGVYQVVVGQRALLDATLYRLAELIEFIDHADLPRYCGVPSTIGADPAQANK